MGRIRAGSIGRAVAAATAGGIVAAIGLATAPPAFAPPPPWLTADASLVDGNFELTGTNAGDTVVATRVDGTTLDVDATTAVVATGGCTHPNAADSSYVRCTVANLPDLHVSLGGGNDRLAVAGTGNQWLVSLDAGDDTVDTTGADSDGGHYLGGEGRDTFVSGASEEVFEGGNGQDTVSYAVGRAAGVTVDLGAQQGGAPVTEDDYDMVEAAAGTGFADTLTGGAAADDLDGRGGADTLAGGGNADTLVGGTGDDVLGGGAGTDIVSYRTHAQGVDADLDAVADDGAPREADAIGADVEGLGGSSWDDELTGDGATNILVGEWCTHISCANQLAIGDDTLDGGGGADWVLGSNGDDTLAGGSAGDLLLGEAGDDALAGGSGDDTLDGGADTDACDVGADGGSTANCEVLPLARAVPG